MNDDLFNEAAFEFLSLPHPVTKETQKDPIIVALPKGTIIHTVKAHQGDDVAGWLLRGYHEEKKEYYFINSWFHRDLPRWTEVEENPMHKEYGTPTMLQMEIGAMKYLNIPYGSIKKFVICRVHDWDSVFMLKRLIEVEPQTPLAKTIQETRLFLSRADAINISGHQIKGISFEMGGAISNHPPHLVNDDFTKEEMEELCRKYFIKLQDMVMWNFNVIIDTEPKGER